MIDLKDQFAFGNIKSLAEGVGYLTMPAFAIAAIALVFYFIVGAFQYLTSGGDKNALQSAQKMIIHAIMGFILLMVLFLILQFLPEFFGLKGFKIIQ